MEHYRRTAHTRFDIELHLVWITKYRKRLLRGDVGVRLRQIVPTICAEPEVEILKGYVSVDHVHLFVSCPPHASWPRSVGLASPDRVYLSGLAQAPTSLSDAFGGPTPWMTCLASAA